LRYTELVDANADVAANILTSLNTGVSNNWEDYFGFSEADLYRAYVPDYSFDWGSNLNLANAGNLNAILSAMNVAGEGISQAMKTAEQLHYFHGINPLGIVYLSNMYNYGAENCANEIYHTWFWEGTDYSNALTSLNGPAPGYVPGGANQFYGVEEFSPPFGQPPMKSYLDFNNSWPGMAYSITEPAIYYQAAYIRLLANFVNEGESVGIEESHLWNGISVFPNPARHQVNISGLTEMAALLVYDEQGKLISNQTISPLTPTVDVSKYAPGVYLLQLESPNLNKTAIKVVVE